MTVTRDVTGVDLLEISLMLKNCNDVVIDEEKVCCMCGTTKFIGRVNTGEKYYCNRCIKKINDSGMDYWKSCTQIEFFESVLSRRRKGRSRKSTNMLSSLKEQFEKFKKEAKENDEI
ncbi:MAG: hypothetical protein ACW9XA_07190 [Candidatus Nitrosopumilus sp. bin_6a]